jgi:hypothetical protein
MSDRMLAGRLQVLAAFRILQRSCHDDVSVEAIADQLGHFKRAQMVAADLVRDS